MRETLYINNVRKQGKKISMKKTMRKRNLIKKGNGGENDINLD
jgi:hypothetical protein